MVSYATNIVFTEALLGQRRDKHISFI